MLNYVTSQLEDPDEFIALVERLYNLPDSWEDQINFKDGRVFNRRSVALDAGDGAAARIWVFTDVTEAWSARIDPLTGLLNRRAYGRELPEFMAAATTGQIKAFALMDVDHFKPYNDHYGHSAGDAALEALGELLRAEAAQSTRAYRIGGEEFAMTSLHRERAAAAGFYERVRRRVGEAKIPHTGNAPYGVLTVSMGVALVSGKAELRDVFDEADRALYRAKKRGRNALIVVDLNEQLNRLTA
jgi:diguanylate cyclase (GGDEF)-like protein